MFVSFPIRTSDTRYYTDPSITVAALGGDVYHFRDKEGLECDAVVHLRNGSYGLVEIKLGGETLKAPSFLMVLTGIGEYPYRRAEDGVLVVPIGCLKD